MRVLCLTSLHSKPLVDEACGIVPSHFCGHVFFFLRKRCSVAYYQYYYLFSFLGQYSVWGEGRTGKQGASEAGREHRHLSGKGKGGIGVFFSFWESEQNSASHSVFLPSIGCAVHLCRPVLWIPALSHLVRCRGGGITGGQASAQLHVCEVAWASGRNGEHITERGMMAVFSPMAILTRSDSECIVVPAERG